MLQNYFKRDFVLLAFVFESLKSFRLLFYSKQIFSGPLRGLNPGWLLWKSDFEALLRRLRKKICHDCWKSQLGRHFIVHFKKSYKTSFILKSFLWNILLITTFMQPYNIVITMDQCIFQFATRGQCTKGK